MESEQEVAKAERRALLVDDDPNVTEALSALLDLEGWSARVATSAQEAYRALPTFQPDLILLDLNLGEHSGLDVLEQIKAFDESIAVVMISGYGTIEAAVGALKRGAASFLQKPFDAVQLKLVLTQVDEAVAGQRKIEALRRSRFASFGIYGVSAASRELQEKIEAAASTSSPVLIEGEQGSGKRLVARALHDHSPRARQAFVECGCSGMSLPTLEAEVFGYERGAVPNTTASKAGLLEVADRGTLFIRQIVDLPLAFQAHLATVLDTKTFRRVGGVRPICSDFRLVASTRTELRQEAEAGRFSDDLFYRLQVLHLRVPSLRERPEDIPYLVTAILERLADDLGYHNPRVTTGAMDKLTSYTWPGNIRELKNTLERALIFSRGAPITSEQIHVGKPRKQESTGKVIRPLDEMMGDYIRQAVELTGGNVREAARRLQISPSTLYSRMKEARD